MKKINLSLFIAIITFTINNSNIYSQENTLPVNGNVGIGTMNPSAALDVNGNVHIDSMLMVKDSILIRKNARVLENMTVEGNSIIKLDATVEKELYVEGNAQFKTNVNIDGTLFYPYAASETSNLGKDILLIDPVGGKITRGTTFNLSTVIYNPLESCKTDVSGNIPNPLWSNGLNKIFTNCNLVKVGIGTDAPRVKLDVIGTTFSSRLSLGAANPNNIGNKYFHLKTLASTNASQKIVEIENNTEELFSINNSGQLKAKEYVDKIKLKTLLANSSSAKVFTIDNNGGEVFSVSNTGQVKAKEYHEKIKLKTFLVNSSIAKVLTVENNTTEVFSVDNTGKVKTSQIINDSYFANYGNFANQGIFTNYGEARLLGETIAYKKVTIHPYLPNTVDEDLFVIGNDNEFILKVNNLGYLKARKIIVTSTDWPDYVFEKDYKLNKLADVEQYIKTNGHLPNIPSEKEIIENGIDLSETNKLMMEKIEELTLYLIQQQKELDELKLIINKK